MILLSISLIILTIFRRDYTILSLTVRERKNRCIPCIYKATAIFGVVTKYGNLLSSFTLFLNCLHFTFGYELIISLKW